MSTGELQKIQNGLRIYELIPDSTPVMNKREELMSMLSEVIVSDGYFERALGKCTRTARVLLDVIAECGGTSGSMVEVQEAFIKQEGGLYYYPAHRTLTRLGLAYAVDSTTRPYYLLPEGILTMLT